MKDINKILEVVKDEINSSINLTQSQIVGANIAITKIENLVGGLVEKRVMPKITDLTIGQKIDAILLWQNCGTVHPLTCGCSSETERKFNIISTRIDGKPLFIECTNCGVIQDWIPDSVYNYYIQSNFTG